MRALILFHLKSGIRVAVKSFAPLFCALLAGVMLNMYPAAAVRAISAQLFRNQTDVMVSLCGLAFLLPAWGAGRLSAGLDGWMRHLPVTSVAIRRGLALGLVTLQAPLGAAVVLLAFVAVSQRIEVTIGLVRGLVLLTCGAAAALPVRPRLTVMVLSLAAAAFAVWCRPFMLVVPVGMLLAVDAVAGPVYRRPRRPAVHAAGALFGLRTAWRAVRWRILVAYAAGLLVLGATALFVANNEITGALLSATVRFCGAFSSAVFFAALVEQLAVRRPVWPWARSFPWSSGQRIRSDAFMLAAAAFPLLVLSALMDFTGSLAALAACPFLAARAAGHLRGVPGRRMGTALVGAEGFAVASVLAVLPWTAWAWLATAPLAARAAIRAETRQKVTRWVELHHTVAGDPLSWNG